jgi:ATP-dependent Lon protease
MIINIKKLKSVPLVLKEDMEIELDDFENFLKELKSIKKNKTINLTDLTVENFKVFIEVIINNLDLFKEVSFGFLSTDLKKILDEKIEQLECSVETQGDKKQDNHIKKTLKLSNSSRNIDIILSYNEKKTKNKPRIIVNGREVDSTEDLEDFMPFGFGSMGSSNVIKKKNNPALERMEVLLNSPEIDEDVKSTIKNLLDKIKQRSGNQGSDAENAKYLDIINVIGKIFILKKEDDNNIKNFTLGKLCRALKAKDQKEYLKIKEDITHNLFKILIPSKSAKRIVDVLMKSIDEVVAFKVTGKVNKRCAILLHGEPGLGKTTVPKEFAKINNIPYVILNAGDEKKFFIGGLMIYSGSSWGKIAQVLADKKAKTVMIILDEVDKYGKETQESLLPLLDINQKFEDQHLELPLPINECIFVLTANKLDKISDPLKDRCEVITVDHFSFREKKELAKRILFQGLAVKFPDKVFDVTPKALDLIVKKSIGSGGRQVHNNCQSVIAYIANFIINDSHNNSNITISENFIYKSLESLDFFTSPIVAEESKVGYINGVVVKRYVEGYKENKVHVITNISCVATSDYNNQHIITPIDQNLNSLIQSLSRSCGVLLGQMGFSNKNLNISIKEPEVSFHESRSLAALLAVSIISSITNYKIKSCSTIVAELLPNNDLEFDPKTIEKIQLAFNHGVKKFVIGNVKKTGDTEDDSPYSVYINNLIKRFNLKLKKKDGKKLIFYHDSATAQDDSVYEDLEICIVDNLKDGLDYLLINN